MASQKNFGLFLRLNAKSFEPLNAIRAKYPVQRLPSHKEDPLRPLLPHFGLIRCLPGASLPAIQERLASLAAVRKPWTLKIGAPTITGAGKSSQHEGCGIGFLLPAEEIEQYRLELYKELSEAIAAGNPNKQKKYAFSPKKTHILGIRSATEGFTKEKASETLRELERQYPDGFGTIVAEGFAIQEYLGSRGMVLTNERMKGEYAFGAK